MKSAIVRFVPLFILPMIFVAVVGAGKDGNDGVRLQVQNGHSQSVSSIRWGSDGKIFASSSEDSSIRLWNQDGSLIKELTGHKDSVRLLLWNPGARVLASASDDGKIRFWRSDGSLIRELSIHKKKIYSMSWSPDGKILVSVNGNNTVVLWGADGKKLKELTGHTASVMDLSWKSDGGSERRRQRNEEMEREMMRSFPGALWFTHTLSACVLHGADHHRLCMAITSSGVRTDPQNGESMIV